jgi:hypothetical protein
MIRRCILFARHCYGHEIGRRVWYSGRGKMRNACRVMSGKETFKILYCKEIKHLCSQLYSSLYLWYYLHYMFRPTWAILRYNTYKNVKGLLHAVLRLYASSSGLHVSFNENGNGQITNIVYRLLVTFRNQHTKITCTNTITEAE